MEVSVNQERWESGYPSNLPLVRAADGYWHDYGINKKPCS
jgi:hypothetical protein